MAFACIFVPDFPVEAVLRVEPELRSQAVAVFEGKPPLQKIFSLNEQARCMGIDLGMTKIQVEPCTELVLRPRSPLQETAAHAALLDCAQSFSPRIEDTAPDTVILDLSGLESLFGSLPKIARDIARRTSELGLEAHVAIASNPDTAVFAARGFSGVTVIPEGKEAERLGNLPLDVLFPQLTAAGPSEEAAQFLDTFDRWGVRNLRALCALPEIALSERMGPPGVRLQQLVRGVISRTLVPVDPPLVFEEAVELDHPLVLLEPLAFLLAHMLDQLCARLAARALAAQELRLQMKLDHGFHFVEDIPADEPTDHDWNRTTALPLVSDHPGTNRRTNLHRTELRSPEQAPNRELATEMVTHCGRNHEFTRSLQLPVPMLDAKVFLKLLQLDLKAHPPGAPILKVHLSAIPAQPRNAQGGLFLPPTPEPEKLELTLARIAGMVGEDRVGSLQLLDTHRPEAFRMQRFVPAAPKGEKEKVDGTSSYAPITALRMFRPPLLATVSLRDGKPAHVICPKRKEIHGEILWIAGPWRSSGDWWEQDGWARDEWDIALIPVASRQSSNTSRRSPVVGRWPSETHRPTREASTLALYRLVHDLLGGQWFVEGTYD
jgi:protein ImuB